MLLWEKTGPDVGLQPLIAVACIPVVVASLLSLCCLKTTAFISSSHSFWCSGFRRSSGGQFWLGFLFRLWSCGGGSRNSRGAAAAWLPSILHVVSQHGPPPGEASVGCVASYRPASGVTQRCFCHLWKRQFTTVCPLVAIQITCKLCPHPTPHPQSFPVTALAPSSGAETT